MELTDHRPRSADNGAENVAATFSYRDRGQVRMNAAYEFAP